MTELFPLSKHAMHDFNTKLFDNNMHNEALSVANKGTVFNLIRDACLASITNLL